MDVGRVAVERDGRDPRVMSDRHFDDERIELSERRFDGISVGLYWTRGTDLVVVTVDDDASGDAFELVVADNERPLDVFQHPFAFAHARAIELSDYRRQTRVEVEVERGVRQGPDLKERS
jgi:hypothetical protein